VTLEYGSDRLSRKVGEKQAFFAAYNHEKERRYENVLLKNETHLARKDMSVLLAAFLRRRRLPSMTFVFEISHYFDASNVIYRPPRWSVARVKCLL